jgi:hypothetical protein
LTHIRLTEKLLQPSLMFVIKANAYPSVVSFRIKHQRRSITLIETTMFFS